MSASIDFLGDQFIGNDGEKPLLIFDSEIQEVMYKSESFTSPTLCYNVCKFKQMGRSGVIDGACYGEQLVGHLCRRLDF